MPMYRKRLVEAELQLSDALRRLDQGDQAGAETHIAAAMTKVKTAHEHWLTLVRLVERDDDHDSAA